MDDLISRQAAINALTHFTNLSWDKLKIMYPMLTVIEELSSAERHGRWEDYSDDGYYECSVCGEAWTFIDGTPKDNNANYCPMCGAKMDKVSE